MTNQTEQIVTKAEAESYVSPGLAVKPALYRTARSYLKAMEFVEFCAKDDIGGGSERADRAAVADHWLELRHRARALLTEFEGGTE